MNSSSMEIEIDWEYAHREITCMFHDLCNMIRDTHELLRVELTRETSMNTNLIDSMESIELDVIGLESFIRSV